MKTKLIEEFKKRFNLNEEDWLGFLQEYQAKDSPLRTLCESYSIDYNAFRYIAYQLNFDNSTKSSRTESVLNLNKELSIEKGEDYSIEFELEKEVKGLIKKNRQLIRSVTNTRDENNQLRKMLRKEDRKLDFEDKIIEALESQIHSLSLTQYNINYEALVPPTQEYGNVLLMSDEHFGTTTETEVTGNTYNHNVAKKRMLYIVDKVLNSPIRSENLVIFELLDILKGIIHNSEYLSEEGVTGSMLKVVEVYTEVLDRLSPAYKHIDIFVTSSNHDRTTQKPTSVMKWDNFGIMLMKMLEMVIKAKGIKNITFHFTKKEYHLVNINGAEVLATHGDAIRGYQAHSKAQRNHVQSICLGLFKKPYKHMVSGHLHQSMAISNEYGGFNIVNGTLVGTEEYGTTNGFASIEAIQTFFNIDNDGDIDNINFINVTKIT